MRRVFIRFGQIPDSGRSKNHLTGELEDGVSVYEGIEDRGEYKVILPSLTGCACVTLSGCIRLIEKGMMFEVSGDVCGNGSDGEPILTNCKVIRSISRREINEAIR